MDQLEGDDQHDIHAEEEGDDVDVNNYKGIYFGDNAEKFQDEVTGAHFDFSDMCNRLSTYNERLNTEPPQKLEPIKPDPKPLRKKPVLLQKETSFANNISNIKKPREYSDAVANERDKSEILKPMKTRTKSQLYNQKQSCPK